jgi:hypothetical protein
MKYFVELCYASYTCHVVEAENEAEAFNHARESDRFCSVETRRKLVSGKIEKVESVMERVTERAKEAR